MERFNPLHLLKSDFTRWFPGKVGSSLHKDYKLHAKSSSVAMRYDRITEQQHVPSVRYRKILDWWDKEKRLMLLKMKLIKSNTAEEISLGHIPWWKKGPSSITGEKGNNSLKKKVIILKNLLLIWKSRSKEMVFWLWVVTGLLLTLVKKRCYCFHWTAIALNSKMVTPVTQ